MIIVHLCPQKKSSYFLQLPIERQIREIYARTDFYNRLQLRFDRPNEGENTIRDVYDGLLYKESPTHITYPSLGTPMAYQFTNLLKLVSGSCF